MFNKMFSNTYLLLSQKERNLVRLSNLIQCMCYLDQKNNKRVTFVKMLRHCITVCRLDGYTTQTGLLLYTWSCTAKLRGEPSQQGIRKQTNTLLNKVDEGT